MSSLRGTSSRFSSSHVRRVQSSFPRAVQARWVCTAGATSAQTLPVQSHDPVSQSHEQSSVVSRCPGPPLATAGFRQASRVLPLRESFQHTTGLLETGVACAQKSTVSGEDGRTESSKQEAARIAPVTHTHTHTHLRDLAWGVRAALGGLRSKATHTHRTGDGNSRGLPGGGGRRERGRVSPPRAQQGGSRRTDWRAPSRTATRGRQGRRLAWTATRSGRPPAFPNPGGRVEHTTVHVVRTYEKWCGGWGDACTPHVSCATVAVESACGAERPLPVALCCCCIPPARESKAGAGGRNGQHTVQGSRCSHASKRPRVRTRRRR